MSTINLGTILFPEEYKAIKEAIKKKPPEQSIASAIKPILNAEPTKSRLLALDILPDYLAYVIEYRMTR